MTEKLGDLKSSAKQIKESHQIYKSKMAELIIKSEIADNLQTKLTINDDEKISLNRQAEENEDFRSL